MTILSRTNARSRRAIITIEVVNNNDKPYLMKAMVCLLKHVRESSQDEYLKRLSDDYIIESEEWIDKLLASEKSSVYIAKENKIPVGYVIGTITKPFIQRCRIKEIGLIEHCWIEKKYRMNGLATRFIKVVEEWFKVNKIQYIDVQYLLGNIEAENTWEKLGYKPYRVISRKIMNVKA